MSLDIEQELRVFFASAPQTVHHVETLEISHPAMSKTYYLWKEPRVGTITTEDGVRTVQPLAFEAKIAGSENHLDQVFEIPISTADVEDDFRAEMDRIPLDTTDRVRVVFREYRGDDLTDVQSRAVLQVEDVAYAAGVARITAVSPRLNVNTTGELYTPRDVPMLRSIL